MWAIQSNTQSRQDRLTMKSNVSGKLNRYFNVPNNPALSKLSSWYLGLVPIVSRLSCLQLRLNQTQVYSVAIMLQCKTTGKGHRDLDSWYSHGPTRKSHFLELGLFGDLQLISSLATSKTSTLHPFSLLWSILNVHNFEESHSTKTWVESNLQTCWSL